MSDRTCAACSNPAQQGIEICKRCERRTVYHLADQEAHRAELEVALTRMVRMQASNDGGRSTPTSVAWAVMGPRYLDTIRSREIAEFIAKSPPARKAADALHSQKALLVSWVRLITEEYPPLPGPYCRVCSHESCLRLRLVKMPADTVASMSAYLSSWMPLLRRHVAAGELVSELEVLAADIMAVIDTPENRTKVHVGQCIQTLEDGSPCIGEVWAIVPADIDKRPKLACQYCGHEWYGEQWATVGEKIMKRKVA